MAASAGVPWAEHPELYIVLMLVPSLLSRPLWAMCTLLPTNHGLLFLFPPLLTHPLPAAQLGMEHSPRAGGTAKVGVQRGLEGGTAQGCGARRELGLG